MPEEIYGLVIPKYGMVMAEGVISIWYVEEGAPVMQGQELVDIDTEKVSNAYESPRSGVLRRKLVAAGQSAPIGALFGVIAPGDVPEEDIDTFIAGFNRQFAASRASSTAPSAQIVELPRGAVRYFKVGSADGTPVVLVHGFGGDLNNWLLNQEALAESRTVYALDLPGHGGSQKEPALSSVQDLTGVLAAFLQSLTLERVHMVGHSLGGAVATQLAINHPARIASLTLLAPVGLGSEINGTFIEGMLNADRRKEMKRVLEALFHEPALVSAEMVMNVLRGKRMDGAVPCLKAIADSTFSGATQTLTLREAIEKLSLPMQIIWGQSDQIIPAAQAAALPSRISVHVLERAGHMVHIERAKDVNELIRQFIDSH